MNSKNKEQMKEDIERYIKFKAECVAQQLFDVNEIIKLYKATCLS